VTREDVGKLCFKLFGVYTFIVALLYAGSALGVGASFSEALPGYRDAQRGMSAQIAIMFFFALLLFCLSAMLWFRAEKLTERIFPKIETSDNSFSVNPEIIKQIAFTCIGILILAGALPELAGIISSLFVMTSPYSIRFLFDLGQTIIRIILGVWLILGSARLRSFAKVSAEKIGNINQKDW
jgi:hypothetical protein